MRFVAVALGAVVLIGAGQVDDAASFSAAQADRGAKTYQQTCAACHGEAFQGAAGAPALAGPSFKIGWNGKTAEELFTFVKTSMPPGQESSLSDQQYSDVIAAILRANNAKAVAKELPADAAALKSLRVHID